MRLQDLSAQFYLSEASLGTNRATACKDKLQELNTAVTVTASTAELTEEFISQYQVLSIVCYAHVICLGPSRQVAHHLQLLLCHFFVSIQVVVCTNTMMKESIQVDEICHKLSIGFIKADTYGVFANVFCDFGKGFKVLDVDGKPALG